MIHNPPRRVLLIRRKALGDALVSLPAVFQIARAWPEARLDLVIDRPFASLLDELTPGVNVISWPPEPGNSWLTFLRSGGYDLVVDWLGSPRTALWSVLTGASLRVGYDLPRRKWAYNIRVARNRDGCFDLRGFAGEAFLDPLRDMGLMPGPWGAGAAQQAKETATSDLSNCYMRWRDNWLASDGYPVALVMSATWETKSWPNKHIVDLFEGLKAEGLNPVLVTGPGDQVMEEALRQDLPDDAFAPPTNLLELADLLGRAKLFVGTDNGSRHLAALLDVPTVTLFGPTDPVGWNPEAPNHVSLTADAPCAPCDLTVCNVEGRPCLEQLQPMHVISSVRKMLAEKTD